MSTDTGFGSSSGVGGGSDSGDTGPAGFSGFSSGDHTSEGLGTPSIDLTEPGKEGSLSPFSDTGPSTDEPQSSGGGSVVQMMGGGGAAGGVAADEPAGAGSMGGGGGQDSVVSSDAGSGSADTSAPGSDGETAGTDSASQQNSGDDAAQSDPPDAWDASFEVQSYSAEFAPGGGSPESGESAEANANMISDHPSPQHTGSSNVQVNPGGVVGHSVDNPDTPGADITFFNPNEVEANHPTHSSGDHPDAPDSLDPNQNASDSNNPNADSSPGTSESQGNEAATQGDVHDQPPPGVEINTGEIDAAPGSDGLPGVGGIEWAADNLDELTRDGAPTAETGGHPEGSAEGSPTGELHGRDSGDGILDMIHNALDAMGMIPALGVVPDAVNTGLYLVQGDWRDAGFSAAAMVPALGQGATLTKQGLRLSREGAEALGKEGIERAARQASNLGGKAAKSEGALRASARRKAARVIEEQARRNGSHPAESLLNNARNGLVTRSSRKHSHLADNFLPDVVHGDTKASGAIHRLGIGDAHINQAIDAASERQGAIIQRTFYDVDGLPMDLESIKYGIKTETLKLSREQLKNLQVHPGWFPNDL